MPYITTDPIDLILMCVVLFIGGLLIGFIIVLCIALKTLWRKPRRKGFSEPAKMISRRDTSINWYIENKESNQQSVDGDSAFNSFHKG